MNAETYARVNGSFRKTLVYRVGVNAGFFSELNNMLLAMLYCLQHRIKFVLFSRDANFGSERGLPEWFHPFSEESEHRFHSTYNHRVDITRGKREIGRRLRLQAWKAATRTNYLTHDLFNTIRHEARSGLRYDFPELGISGDIHDALRELSGFVWKFNDETAALVEDRVRSLSLPARYISLHIRSGDKACEAPGYEPARYLEMAQRHSPIRSVFVATDDFANIESLVAGHPGWDFYFACDASKRGYAQREFDAMPPDMKRREMTELFATVTAILRSELFIGTFSSNVGSFIGMRMPLERCLDVGGSSWFVC